MRKALKVFSTVFLVLVVALLTVEARESGDKSKPKAESIYGPAGTPRWAVLNINNWTNWMRSDAPGALSPAGDNQGVYPRGTGNVIYTDGFYFGSKCYKDAAKTQPATPQTVRVGGKGYGYGLRPGRVIGLGAEAVAADPGAADVRIYRIRRDYLVMTEDELKRDAAEVNEIAIAEVTDAQMAAVVAQYEKDWKEWPVQYGAPYIDRNGNGRYDPPPAGATPEELIEKGYDEPGIAGADPNSPADQVIWTVANDLDPGASLAFQRSEPTGLEIQFTSWGYKRTDALGNLFFSKIKFINKGGVDIGGGQKGAFYLDSMYVCKWSDPDLGSFSDDLVGCDTTLGIGFVYNANAVDLTFRRFNSVVPSAGYDFLQGPLVRGSPSDVGIFDLKPRPGYKNLKMTSFSYFSAGSPYSDPCNRETAGYLCNTGQWWKMLRGFAPIGTLVTPDIPYASGPFPVSKFPLSGDPVTRTGFIDGLGTDYSFVTGDRRFLLSTGPFSLAPGDTQEIVIGVVAGLGSDRLSSVAVMKFNDRFVQNTYDALFQVPRPPKSPDVKVAELDGQIVLEWGSNAALRKDIEETVSQPGGYRFEGYNVYQLPSRGSRLSEAKRVATYDLLADPTVVLDEQFDQASGQILKLPVHYGSNSGVQRYFNFKRDYIRDIDKIYNYQEYYLAVTAYSVATVPGYLPAALESAPVVLTVRPHAPKPGARVYGKALEKIPVKLTAGVTDIALPVLLVDPTRTKSTTYTVTFEVTGGNTFWLVKDKSTGTTLYRSGNLGSLISGNLDDDFNYPVINGFMPIVIQEDPVVIEDSTGWIGTPPPQLEWGHRFADPPSAHGYVTTAADLSAHYLAQFRSSYDMAKLRRIELRFGPANASRAYRLRRTGPGTEYVIQTGVRPAAPNGEGFVPVPFSAWDLDNPGGPRQLTLSWRDQDNSATWNPPVGTDNVEIIFVYFKTYDPNGDQFTYPTQAIGAAGTPRTKVGPAINNECTVGAAADIMYGFSFASLGAQIDGSPGSVANSRLYVRPKFVLNADLVFEFSTQAPSYSAELAKDDAVARMGVFPNPYYAFNAAETNRFNRFVTFTNLPPVATIRIFNLAGQLVRTIRKDTDVQYQRWDLLNEAGFPVASGMYIAHIEAPDIGATKVLKVAIIQEQEILDTY